MSLSLHPNMPEGTLAASAAPSAPSVPGSTEAKIRTRLFTKYVALFVAVVGVALLSNGTFEVFFYYREHKAALIRIQHEQAEAAAAKISQFVKEIESQLGWTTQLPWSAGSIQQRRFDALRLLRQVPAITELSQVDSTGKERLRVSRLAMDVVDSGIDLSKDPKFTRGRRQQGLLRPGLFPPGVRALHDAGAGRHPEGCRRQHCGGQPEADLGRGFADQGRRARPRLCGRPRGAPDRASGHQPGAAQYRHVEARATCKQRATAQAATRCKARRTFRGRRS